MRDLTSTELDQCAGGAFVNGPEPDTGGQTAAGPTSIPLTIPYMFASPVADSEATIKGGIGYPN